MLGSVALCDLNGGLQNFEAGPSCAYRKFSELVDTTYTSSKEKIPSSVDLILIHCNECLFTKVCRLVSFRVIVRISSEGSSGYSQKPYPIIHNDGSIGPHLVDLPSSTDSHLASTLIQEPYPVIHNDGSIELHLVDPPRGIDSWSNVASILTDFDEVKSLARDPRSHDLSELFFIESTLVGKSSLSALSILCQGFLVAHVESDLTTSSLQDPEGVLSSIGWNEVDDETKEALDPAPEAAKSAGWWTAAFQGSDDLISQIKEEWEQSLNDREWKDGEVFSLLQCISKSDPEAPTVEEVADAYTEIQDCLE